MRTLWISFANWSQKWVNFRSCVLQKICRYVDPRRIICIFKTIETIKIWFSCYSSSTSWKFNSPIHLTSIIHAPTYTLDRYLVRKLTHLEAMWKIHWPVLLCSFQPLTTMPLSLCRIKYTITYQHFFTTPHRENKIPSANSTNTNTYRCDASHPIHPCTKESTKPFNSL